MSEYAEKVSNDEYFCRYVAIKQIITYDKKVLIRKTIIFFSDFYIKRLASSKHLLIDTTFIFPKNFMQTIIIMYFDEIIEIIIPGIYVAINNKT